MRMGDVALSMDIERLPPLLGAELQRPVEAIAKDFM